jgi:DNA polymerase I-like protein with 3'-5' exonuclease and polymerase domains
MPIQATAAELMKLAMADVGLWIETDVRPAGIWCQPLLTVHDELILEVEDAWAEGIKEIVEGKFSRVLTDRDTGRELCSVPLRAEGTISERWEKS